MTPVARATSLLIVTVLMVASSPVVEASIVRIVIDTVESPSDDGQVYGDVGAYERLVGRAFGELDPDDPRNALIQDLDLAPRNERGRVEYVVDFVMRKPVDLARSSGVLRYDAPNRGNARNVDPYFQGLGHILLAAGWQGDVPGGTRRLRVEVPVARQGDGAAVTGRVRAESITRRATHTLPLSGGAFSGTHVPYAAASLDQPTATVTQRRRADDPADLVGAVRRAHGVSSRCAAEQRRETSESPPACQGQSTRGCLSQGRPSPARTRSADRGETDRCDSRDPIGPASARNA